MTTYYSIDAANERLPEVREILELLRTQRAELIRLRDRLVRVAAVDGAPGAEGDPGGGLDLPAAIERGGVMPPESPEERDEETSEDGRLIRLRIRALVDQMGASVLRLDEWGITLRDIESGLIDFPALVNGRQVWLCWRLGEDTVDWWHELEAGFGGRRRLIDLA